MKSTALSLIAAASLTSIASADATGGSVNAFGLALHQRLAAKGGNVVTSPWSIQQALAMTWGGANGKTKDEMAKVLHYGADEKAVHEGFAALAADLQKLAAGSAKRIEDAKQYGGPSSPLEILSANRLFGQQGQAFEQPFLTLTQNTYQAPLEMLDFVGSTEKARLRINGWVEQQTKDRIRELIPAGVLTGDTRLVLTNAVYFKAPWADEFSDEPAMAFSVNGTQSVKVPGLVNKFHFGYTSVPGGVAVTIPYADRGLEFVIFLPDSATGLAAMEKKLTPAVLEKAAMAESRDIILHVPKFKLEPDRVMLADHLAAMGMPSAFDKPAGSADFSRMAPKKPDDYLYISHVIHKAFVAIDKHGTEAAAATAVTMARAGAALRPDKPLEIRVDRPFAFAIQHTASSACLFLGRVTDPR